MKPTYMKGILAGVAGGIAISAILVLQVAVNMLLMPYLYSGSSAAGSSAMTVLFSMTVSLLSYGFYGILLLLTGTVSVWLARELLHDYSEALVVSGISGVIASIVWVATNTLITVINGLFLFPSILETAALPGQNELSILGIVVVMDLCCCGPVFVVIATVMALIGGGICALVIVKQ